MLFRDTLHTVEIVYRFTVPLPIRLQRPPEPEIEFWLQDNGPTGRYELRYRQLGLPSFVLRYWSSMEEAEFCCATGIDCDYTPLPNLFRSLKRAGFAEVVIGPHVRLRYSDPAVTERGFWPVPKWTGPRPLLYAKTPFESP